MAEPSGVSEVPARGAAPSEPYLSRWGAQAQQRRWPLLDRVVTLGRASCADVVIDGDPLVSRVHATLERVAGVWTIDDNGLSRNGTFVNGRRLSGRLQLHDRDEIRVGITVLTFCAPAEEDSVHTLVGEPLPTAVRLTPAQRGVLIALCRPCKDERHYATPATNQQISEELFLSVDAVKTHLRALFHKLGIEHLPQNQKRVRLVEMALQYGLVSSHDL
ncbi:MAG TPA: FHA domain-containing protein [Jatrophihabitantaceae bacterium]|jgi:pSer/pThr/pTyr-binding forkhead associated (FHA) protein|nr:FHA domain-containing protein [Jatrophihabitantaceae bacterium]